VVSDGFIHTQRANVAQVLADTNGPRLVVPMSVAFGRTLNAEIVRAARGHAAVSIAPPLGPDWVLAEVGVRRLVEAGARSSDTIVLAAPAVKDSRTLDDVSKAARLLSAVWGGRVHVGVLGGQDTLLPDAIDVARAYGQRVVVSTYLLTDGPQFDAVKSAGADVVTAPLLTAGVPDPRMVALIAERVRTRGSWPLTG
jgi:sirohydrochlorin ferrochelatase